MVPIKLRSTTISKKVAHATKLKRQLDQLNEVLDLIKIELRDTAKKAGLGPCANVELYSPVGTCTIIYVNEKPYLVEGVDLDWIKEKIPEPAWHSIFAERVQLRENALLFLNDLPDRHRRLVARAVQIKPHEPRVVLPK